MEDDSEIGRKIGHDQFTAIESQMERVSTFLLGASDMMANLNSVLNRIRLPLWIGVVLLLMIFIQNL